MEDNIPIKKHLNDAIDDLLDLPTTGVEDPETNLPEPDTNLPTPTKPLSEDDSLLKKNAANNGTSILPSSIAKNDYIGERSQDIRDDYNQSRSTIQDVLEKGKDTLDYLIELAKGTDKYEYFDSISKLIKTLTDATSTMMENQQTRNDLDDAVDGENNQPSTVNNNVFVGSTKELLEMINNGKKDAK